MSQSEIVRVALMEFFSKGDGSVHGAFIDYSEDLAGSVAGVPDLSTNKKYLDGYGK